MKLRIEDNSIRLRLRKSEVQELGHSGRVGGHTSLPGGSFTYALELKSDISRMDAQKSGNGIIIFLPEKDGKAWAGNEQVGHQAEVALEGGAKLHLLVEKDFVCLDRDPALQQDQYPNPKSI